MTMIRRLTLLLLLSSSSVELTAETHCYDVVKK